MRVRLAVSIDTCPCCGAASFDQAYVLWQGLIDEWRLAPHEVAYINRQQGVYCTSCKANLRSMVLAQAMMRAVGYTGLLRDFVADPQMAHLRVLEINEAGTLSRWLGQLPGHLLARYPEVDMTRLPYDEAAFDLVVHSDTLEHIAHPVRALSECRRVLRPGGACAFTVPLIVERLTLSRAGMSPSYHGYGDVRLDDFLVHTEYGADAWRQVFLAGFNECRISALEHPAAHALVGIK
jgi:SAM-dependent methyltransferase